MLILSRGFSPRRPA